jgi:hypothetical protein
VSDKRYTISEVAKAIVDLCSERIKAFENQLVELNKKENEALEKTMLGPRGGAAGMGGGASAPAAPASGGVDAISGASPPPAASAPTPKIMLPGELAKEDGMTSCKPKLPRKSKKGVK